MPARAIDGIANLRAQLHHRLVHLGLDLLLENDFSTFENFVNMRTQLARFRIDDGELLFDTQSQRMILCAHVGAANLRKKSRAVIPSRKVRQEKIVDLTRLRPAHSSSRRLA